MSVADPSPEKALDLVFQALRERRWLDAAELFDESVLRRVHQDALSHAGSRRRGPQSLKEYRRSRPDLSEATAQEMWQSYQQHFDSGRWLEDRYARIRSAEELEALAPLQLLARHLEAQDPRTRIRGHGSTGDLPQDLELEVFEEPTVIGSVRDRGELAHVVYRWGRVVEEGEEWMRDVRVTSLRKAEHAWRLLDERVLAQGRWDVL